MTFARQARFLNRLEVERDELLNADNRVGQLFASVIWQACKDIKRCGCIRERGSHRGCVCMNPGVGQVWTAIQYIWRWHRDSPFQIHCALAGVDEATVRKGAGQLLSARYPGVVVPEDGFDPHQICMDVLEVIHGKARAPERADVEAATG